MGSIGACIASLLMGLPAVALLDIFKGEIKTPFRWAAWTWIGICGACGLTFALNFLFRVLCLVLLA